MNKPIILSLYTSAAQTNPYCEEQPVKKRLTVQVLLILLFTVLFTNSQKQSIHLHAQTDSQTVIPVPLSGASADAQGSLPYTTGAQIVNPDSETATVDVVRFNPDGTEHSTVTYTVDANDSLTIFPLDNPAGRSGSIEIRSEQNITAIFNIVSADFSMGGSYTPSQPSTEILLPLLSKTTFDTMFGLQNTNDVAATVSIEYSDGTSRQETIPAHSNRYVYQREETHSLANFAGVITTNVPVSASVIQTNYTISLVYSGFVDSSTSPTFPLVSGHGAFVSGIQIQNGGTEATEITVTYTPSLAGSACTETQTITAGGSQTFALLAFSNGSNSTCEGGATFVGSATVTSNSTNQPLVGIGNQLGAASGETYTSFSAENATNTIILPLIMDRNGGFFTGFNIANVGDSSTNVSCTFTDTDYTVSGEILVGGGLTDLQGDKISDGYVGSATCIGEEGSKIVSVVNQLGASAAVDQFFVYEGINR